MGIPSRQIGWSNKSNLLYEVLKQLNKLNKEICASLLLDDYPNAIAAYSLRRLTKSYSGPVIRVRRSSDNTETDIGFDSGGCKLDEAALLSFVGGGIGFVTIWYDQSGNGVDQIRTIASRQPLIVQSGAVYTINDKPALLFSSMSMRSAINVSLTSPAGEWSSFGVVRPISFDSTRVILSSDPITPRIGQFMRILSSTNPRYSTAGFNTSNTAFADSGPLYTSNQVILNSIRTTSTVEIFANGIGDGSTITTGTPNTGISPLDIGYRDNVLTNVFVGYIQELIHYPLDSTSFYQNMVTSINSYYNTF
jgi:hypothetical protein